MTQQRPTPEDGVVNVTIAVVRFEHLHAALGVGESRPRLSWTVVTTVAAWYQASYEIEAYGPDGRLRERTERIASDQSALVPWPFACASGASTDRLRHGARPMLSKQDYSMPEIGPRSS